MERSGQVFSDRASIEDRLRSIPDQNHFTIPGDTHLYVNSHMHLQSNKALKSKCKRIEAIEKKSYTGAAIQQIRKFVSWHPLLFNRVIILPFLLYFPMVKIH